MERKASRRNAKTALLYVSLSIYEREGGGMSQANQGFPKRGSAVQNDLKWNKTDEINNV